MARATPWAGQLVGALVGVLALGGCVADDEPDEPIAPGDPRYVRDPALDVDNRSRPREQRSHNAGQNCMRCHQALGPGRGRFTVAATVLGPDGAPHPDSVLELYAAPPSQGGAPAFVVEGDALGNVFTTAALPLPDRPLFVVVRSRDGALRNQMPFPTSSGACNQCHRPGFGVKLEPAP
jgi:mono/diheme cytochrome c family protein